MTHRIYIPIFGSGLGHASRMALVAARLQQGGVLIRFSSSFDAVDYLRKAGFQCDRVAGIDAPWDQLGGLSELRQILRKIPSWTRTFIRQMRFELHNIESFKPDVILSDTRLSAVLAALFTGTPSFTVINQLRIDLPPNFKSRFSPLMKKMIVDRITQMWWVNDAIFVPDLPPPYTLSERNVWGVIFLQGKMQYVGFIIPRPRTDLKTMEKVRRILDLTPRKRLIVAQISGPAPTRKALTAVVLEVAKKVSQDRSSLIISEGIAGGRTEPVRIKNGWYYEWCPCKDELLQLADLVITRGGHSTIGQLMTLGKPMLVVPIANHSEQIGNAYKVNTLGLGRVIEQNNVTADSVCDNIDMILNDSKYRDSAAKIRTVSLRYNGVENVVSALAEYI